MIYGHVYRNKRCESWFFSCEKKKASSRNFPQQVDSWILKTELGLVMDHPECTHIHTRSSRGSSMSNTDHAVPQVWNTAWPVKHSYYFTQWCIMSQAASSCSFGGKSDAQFFFKSLSYTMFPTFCSSQQLSYHLVPEGQRLMRNYSHPAPRQFYFTGRGRNYMSPAPLFPTSYTALLPFW